MYVGCTHPLLIVSGILTTGIPPLLGFTYIFFLLQMGGLWQPCVQNVYWRQFPTAFGTLVFVTFWQFLKYFKLIVLVMVISDF